eukprot:10261_1
MAPPIKISDHKQTTHLSMSSTGKTDYLVSCTDTACYNISIHVRRIDDDNVQSTVNHKTTDSITEEDIKSYLHTMASNLLETKLPPEQPESHHLFHSITYLVCIIVTAVVCYKITRIYFLGQLSNSNNQILTQPSINVKLEIELTEHQIKSINIRQTVVDRLAICEKKLEPDVVKKLLDDFQNLLDHIQDTDIPRINGCDIEKCKLFQMNYRDRSNSTDFSFNAVNRYDIVMQHIVAKIHCFCYHHLCSISMQRQVNLLSNLTAIPSIQDRVNQKYNQLKICESSSGTFTKFIFGREFEYVDDDEKYSGNIQIIKKKYSSLKIELTSNHIAIITMNQFDAECDKAQIHYDSYYRKKHYPDEQHPLISIEHLLSLMVYCNFDGLQNTFSQTYRENIDNHNYFYHLGKLLKESVVNFGTPIRSGAISKFYHGINQKLVPKEIVGALGKGISIYCPLSTSSSYAVAVNFTAGNQGLVMTFGGNTSKAKYFSVDWLSDYANEREHLFLQNQHELQIKDIMDCTTGQHFDEILFGLKAIDAMIYATHHFVDDRSTESRNSLMNTVMNIIHHQLYITFGSNSHVQYKPWSNLHEYAQKLFNVYFGNKTKLTVNYTILEDQYVEFFQLICLTEYQ